MHHLEGDIDDRIKLAKQRAESVYYGHSDVLEDQVMRLQFLLSREYNMPLFSDYFEKRTLDQLIFEMELIKLSREPATDKMSDIMKDEGKKKELESLFDDWTEENTVDLSDTTGYDEEMVFKEFMETGEFITEEKEDNNA
jgi:hypothetical protein